jgi:SAM-dependent methyltransferase
MSLRLIAATGLAGSAPVIDVGGGASVLVDGLLEAGFTDVTVLDLSGAALAASRARLGRSAGSVRWIEADITRADLPPRSFDLWHDRAVFHFLTDRADRQAYLRVLRHALRPGASVVIATFAEDGPERCSGLPVRRYAPSQLHAELGDDFEWLASEREEHVTPGGVLQQFQYSLFRGPGA